MNINPSDMDVGQGYSLADTEADAQDATATSDPASKDTEQSPTDIDARSKAVAAAADRTLAREAANTLNDHFASNDTGLKIRVLDDADSTVQVEVVDTQSNKVLRKIPEDDMVKLAASIKAMTGVLVDKPA